jgi:hypothetical protein
MITEKEPITEDEKKVLDALEKRERKHRRYHKDVRSPVRKFGGLSNTLRKIRQSGGTLE